MIYKTSFLVVPNRKCRVRIPKELREITLKEKPVSKHPELQLEITNLMALCLSCHRGKHPELPGSLFIDP